jgi:hypothetical protein
MLAYVVEHAVAFAVVYWTAAVLGLVIKLINDRKVTMGDVVLAAVFGLFYLISQAWGWETVLLQLPERKR